MELIVTKLPENVASLFKAYLQQQKIKEIVQESGIFSEDSYPDPDQVVFYHITYQPEVDDVEVDNVDESSADEETIENVTDNIVEQTNIFYRFGDTAYINLILSVNLKEDLSNVTLQIAFLSQEGDQTNENLLMYIDFELFDQSKEVTEKTVLPLPIDEFEELSNGTKGDDVTNG